MVVEQSMHAESCLAGLQTVHFVRHGEGFHNIGIVNLDAHLTEVGWKQAEALNRHIAKLKPSLDIQVRQAGRNIGSNMSSRLMWFKAGRRQA